MIYEIVGLITNITLAILTGVYVFLTWRLVSEARSASKAQSDALLSQMRLKALPHIYPEVRRTQLDLCLSLSNTGHNPAYDVDVWVLGVLFEEDLSMQTFLNRFVKHDRREAARAIDSSSENNPDNNYGIFDRFLYGLFPAHRSVSASLAFPIKPSSLYVLVQYRDVLGTNYLQEYFMIPPGEEARVSYKIANVVPKGISAAPRIDYEPTALPLKLSTEDNSALPEFLNDFVSLWQHSIPVGYTLTGLPDVEDRGQWYDLDMRFAQ